MAQDVTEHDATTDVIGTCAFIAVMSGVSTNSISRFVNTSKKSVYAVHKYFDLRKNMHNSLTIRLHVMNI